MFAGTAVGELLPPFVVLQGRAPHDRKEVPKEQGSPGAKAGDLILPVLRNGSSPLSYPGLVDRKDPKS